MFSRTKKPNVSQKSSHYKIYVYVLNTKLSILFYLLTLNDLDQTFKFTETLCECLLVDCCLCTNCNILLSYLLTDELHCYSATVLVDRAPCDQ